VSSGGEDLLGGLDGMHGDGIYADGVHGVDAGHDLWQGPGDDPSTGLGDALPSDLV
jgi:hypothetical protein